MGKQAQPARVPTDTVIPLHYMDSNKMFTNIVMDLSLQFDHVLDVEKLVDALERLLQRPGWKKLGARIRRNVRTKDNGDRESILARHRRRRVTNLTTEFWKI
jgi:hypothetical protein